MKLRGVTSRLLQGAAREAGQPEKLDRGRVDYAYRIFWTKIAREWDAARRSMIADAVHQEMASPEFEKNPVERRFEVPALNDGLAHSGASLVALSKVLAALDLHASPRTK